MPRMRDGGVSLGQLSSLYASPREAQAAIPSWSLRIARWMTLVWIALIPVQVPLLGEGGRRLNLAISDLALLIAVIAAFPALRFRRKVWSAWHFLLPAVMALSLLTLGVYTRYSIVNKMVGILVLLAAYLLITSVVTSRSDVHRMVSVFVVSVAVLNAIALVAHLTGVSLPPIGCSEPCRRFRGFMPDANLYGSILVVAFCFVRSIQTAGMSILSKGADWVIQMTLLVGILFTISRSTWVALVVALLLSFWILKPRDWGIWLGFAALGLVLTVVLAGSQIGDLTNLAGRTGSIDSRLVLTDQAMAAVAMSPIFGIGLGLFAEQHGQIIHNTPLWFAAEMGLIGLFAFLGFLGWFARRLYMLYQRSGMELRPIVGGLILGNFAMFVFSLSVEALYQRHWWFLLAITAGLYGQITSERVAKSFRKATDLLPEPQ